MDDRVSRGRALMGEEESDDVEEGEEMDDAGEEEEDEEEEEGEGEDGHKAGMGMHWQDKEMTEALQLFKELNRARRRRAELFRKTVSQTNRRTKHTHAAHHREVIRTRANRWGGHSSRTSCSSTRRLWATSTRPSPL